MMLRTGQQPGVPFRLVSDANGDGQAQRPRGTVQRIKYANNSISVCAKSVRIRLQGRKQFALTFQCDAQSAGYGYVFVGGKNKSTTSQLIVNDCAHVVAFQVLPGNKVDFYVSEAKSTEPGASGLPIERLPTLKQGFKLAKHEPAAELSPDKHDIIIVLSPFPIAAPTSYTLPPKTQDSSASGSGGSTGKAHRTFFQWSSSISPCAKAEIATVAGVRRHVQTVPGVIDIELSCFRLSKTSAASLLTALQGTAAATAGTGTGGGSESERTATLTIQNRSVQTSGGVFQIQPIYGLSSEVEEPSHAQPAPGEPRGEGGVSGGGEGEDGGGATVAAPPMTLDTDSTECVICLTDPRSVVVYPCRHACMCVSCAAAMPAQNNKCPICRRNAKALILLTDKAVEEDEEPNAVAPGVNSRVTSEAEVLL